MLFFFYLIMVFLNLIDLNAKVMGLSSPVDMTCAKTTPKPTNDASQMLWSKMSEKFSGNYFSLDVVDCLLTFFSPVPSDKWDLQWLPVGV